MPVDSFIRIPFLLDFQNLQVDKVVIFFVSVLLAVTVHAEGQAVMATMLGDTQRNAKDRFHFNPLLHLDILGVLCFAVAGFGWPRSVFIDPKNFKHPYFYLIISKFAGPFANLFLAGIAGSILWIMHSYGLEDQVFSIVMSVNLMTFFSNLLPIPPFAGASFFTPFLPKERNAALKISLQVLPYLLILILILMRINHIDLLDKYLHPAVRSVFQFLVN